MLVLVPYGVQTGILNLGIKAYILVVSELR